MQIQEFVRTAVEQWAKRKIIWTENPTEDAKLIHNEIKEVFPFVLLSYSILSGNTPIYTAATWQEIAELNRARIAQKFIAMLITSPYYKVSTCGDKCKIKLGKISPQGKVSSAGDREQCLCISSMRVTYSRHIDSGGTMRIQDLYSMTYNFGCPVGRVVNRRNGIVAICSR